MKSWLTYLFLFVLVIWMQISDANFIGYAIFEGDCTKYTQYRNEEDLVGITRTCSFGLFFKESLGCVWPKDANCQYDSCIGQEDGVTFEMNDNCRGFWSCLNGYSVHHCCPMSKRFSDGQCIENHEMSSDYCKDECPLKKEVDQNICPPDVRQSTDGFVDFQDNTLSVSHTNVELDETLVFQGNGFIGIWRLANDDFAKTILIEFKLQVSACKGSTVTEQVLVNNDDPQKDASIDIRVIRKQASAELIHLIKTSDTTKKLVTPIKINREVSVTYAYNGFKFVALADTYKQMEVITGDIQRRNSPFIIGKSADVQMVSSFNGILRDIKVYSCIPKDRAGVIFE